MDHDFDDRTVAIPTQDCIKVLEITGRRHSSHDESRIRAILEENCKVDMSSCITFHELKKLAYLMDNPLVKLGWKPIKHEPTGGKDVPNALCDYLAENPRLSFFVTDDTPLTDQLGNPLKIERWIAKKKTPEGSWQHTYIEFDGRMREFVHAQSSRWYMPEKELGDLDPEHFIRTVNYFE